MTKDELMQMARDAGFQRAPVFWNIMSAEDDEVVKFANAILERAAAECESRVDELPLTKLSSDSDFEAMGCAGAIRALKIKEGE